MGNFTNIIRNATDGNKNKENSTLGKFRITPQHGVNVIQYHIYMTDIKRREDHIGTLDISGRDFILKLNKDFKESKLFKNELPAFKKFVKEEYYGFKLNISNIG